MRRISAFLLTVLFMAGLISFPAQSAKSVYFTAVDVNMLELTDETMPFWSGGYLYVDSRIFSGLTLDYGTLYHSRNISKQTLALYTNRNIRSLVFYLDSGITIDGDGRTYHAQAILKGDVVFVPIVIVANFFELRYSTITVNHGTLVRLTVDQDPILSDSAFVDAAADWIEVRYEEYLKTQTSTSTTTPTTPDVPSIPEDGNIIQLAFQVTADSVAANWLSLLETTGGQATFFFTATDLEGQGDLLRQMLAQGHTIGLVVDQTLETPALEQLTQGNQTLYQATTTVTQLVYNISEEDLDAVLQEGYCPISPQVDVSESGLLTNNGASVTMAQIDRIDGIVTVWLGSSTSQTGLSALLNYGAAGNDRFYRLTLLSTQL
ncbi:hypothetical protein RFF05_03240 [Bengtsoniella intestinalis]|uniref:hypothetical protein n=1 Tax=Bengtsoniella intestinalis TaxID=3073143 RepID=UPI00391F2ABB